MGKLLNRTEHYEREGKMINEDSKWKIMRALVPPKDLAAIIKRVADGTINMESAKAVFNTIYEQNLKKLNEEILKENINEQTRRTHD